MRAVRTYPSRHVHKHLQVSIRTDACTHVLTDEPSCAAVGTLEHDLQQRRIGCTHARMHVRTILKNAITGVRLITNLRKQAPWKNAVRNIKHARASSTT